MVDVTFPEFDPEAARLGALTALRAWTRQRDGMPEQRARLLAAAWRAGERNVRELARIAEVSRQTVYDDLRGQEIDPRADRDSAITPPRYAPLTYEQVDDLAEHMAAVLRPAMLATEPEPLASAAWWAAKAMRHLANLLNPRPPTEDHQHGGRADSFDTIADCSARLRRAVHTQWAAEANPSDLARFTEDATQSEVELGENLPVDTAIVTVLLSDGITKLPVTLTPATRHNAEPGGFWTWTADAPLPLGQITGTVHLEINALLTNLSELITQSLHPELLEERLRTPTSTGISTGKDDGIDTPTTATTLTPQERLDAMAERLHPCAAPDVFNGFDLCPCSYGGAFPCPTTEAAWLARGLDPVAESRRVIDAMRPYEPTAEELYEREVERG
jgi:hypothetical protein